MKQKRPEQPRVGAKPGNANAKKLQDGSRRNIYIADADWAELQRLGNGNASAGLREALRLALENVRK
jgi:hypothetical protein